MGGLWFSGSAEEERRVNYIKKRDACRDARGKAPKKSRDWILAKKERRRRQGLETRPDTKYTARKRSGRFWSLQIQKLTTFCCIYLNIYA